MIREVYNHQHRGVGLHAADLDMTVLRGVVYKMRRRGPRTYPCGTPNKSLNTDELEFSMLT